MYKGWDKEQNFPPVPPYADTFPNALDIRSGEIEDMSNTPPLPPPPSPRILDPGTELPLPPPPVSLPKPLDQPLYANNPVRSLNNNVITANVHHIVNAVPKPYMGSQTQGSWRPVTLKPVTGVRAPSNSNLDADVGLPLNKPAGNTGLPLSALSESVAKIAQTKNPQQTVFSTQRTQTSVAQGQSAPAYRTQALLTPKSQPSKLFTGLPMTSSIRNPAAPTDSHKPVHASYAPSLGLNSNGAGIPKFTQNIGSSPTNNLHPSNAYRSGSNSHSTSPRSLSPAGSCSSTSNILNTQSISPRSVSPSNSIGVSSLNPPIETQKRRPSPLYQNSAEADVDYLTSLLVKNLKNPDKVPSPNPPSESSSSTSSIAQVSGTCQKCSEPIKSDGTGCSAMGQLYHIKCFTCHVCDAKLTGLPFYSMDNKPYCERDYLNTLEKCSVCAEPILDRILRANGKPYHPKCFCCVECKKCLDGILFTVDNSNRIHCIEDFHKKFAPKCCVCSEPIMPENGQQETVRIVALDRSFHVNCYKCEDCGIKLSSEEEGRGCYPMDGHILCKTCNNRRFQELLLNDRQLLNAVSNSAGRRQI